MDTDSLRLTAWRPRSSPQPTGTVPSAIASGSLRPCREVISCTCNCQIRSISVAEHRARVGAGLGKHPEVTMSNRISKAHTDRWVERMMRHGRRLLLSWSPSGDSCLAWQSRCAIEFFSDHPEARLGERPEPSRILLVLSGPACKRARVGLPQSSGKSQNGPRPIDTIRYSSRSSPSDVVVSRTCQ